MAKILIVEDDEVLSRMYQKKITLEGYQVVAAYSGEEGLEKVVQENPDLILLDIMMPGIDGFEVIKRMRADSTLKDIPIIILTNLGTSDVFIDEARMLGVKNYLVKYKTSTNDVIEKIKEELGSEQ